MCGIAGYTNSSGSLDRYVIQSMTHALAHRGPDGEACHITPGIALGAVRLRVIDLGGGEQPMATLMRARPLSRTTGKSTIIESFGANSKPAAIALNPIAIPKSP